MATIIPNYNIVEKLGEGHQAIAYKAFHKRNPHRPLVLKILKTVTLSKRQKKHFRLKIEHLKVLHDSRLISPLSFDVIGDVQFFTQAYFEGITLDEWAGKRTKIALDIFFTIACKMAEILNKVHKAGIIHGGVKPHNILIQPETLAVRLIDFITPLDVRDASHFIYDPNFVEGTLAYTSPEQTGRISHKLDFSTDLYSLGIIFYKLLTGRLPFFSTDPLELIHSHLAEEAHLVHEINPEIPSILSKIVAKLTMKQPENRYQSSSGLLADLIRCRDEYTATGLIRKFPLGIHDHTHRVTFISKMVGRDREAEMILEEYNKTAEGSFCSLFISGLPGIGKTRLIQELNKPIVERRGYFTSGKFDVYQKNIPYSSLIQSLKNLVRIFLTESDERVAMWRQRIIKAVGDNGIVITDVIPELEILIGPQPRVKSLPPVEAGNRFHDIFSGFLTSLAGKEHPLALFIDDLQWCDPDSFDFLANILTNYKEHPYLFLIGAYRHNEVDSSHPLTRLIKNIKKNAQPLREIRLEAIRPEHCHEMVSYILNSPLSQTGALADFIARLAEGNPLFVSETLSYLHNADLLILDQNMQWQWDMDRIRQSDMPSSVVALFSSKVKKLPPESIDLLEYCACMGNLFTPDEIALTREITLIDTFETLKPALGQGLLIETKDQFQFVHDRVQEAVLSNIKSERRRYIHWEIGNHLLSTVFQKADLEKMDNIFTIASHLNLGRQKTLDRKTAYQLSDINYHAGNKALASLATEAANEYLRQSLDLLPDDSWEAQYGRTFKIFQKLAKTELMCGEYERSEKLLNQLLDYAKTDLDKAAALAEQTTSLSSIGNFIKAIETANRGLAFFGKSIPDDPELAEKKREQLMNEINSQYGSKIWDTILNMPFTEESKSKIELVFYSELIPDLYMSGLVPQLYLSAVQSTKHCLEGGMDESVIYSFSIMGLYLGEQLKFEQVFQYEDLALNLCEKHPNTFGATRGMNGVAWVTMHTRNHPEELVKHCLKAIQCGKNCGDLYNAGLSYGPLIWGLQVQGANLLTIEQYAKECLKFSQKYHLSFSVALSEAMQAGWIEPMKKDYTHVPMEEKIRKWEKENHISAAGSYYVHMALTHYYFGEYEKAEQYLLEVRRYLIGLTDHLLKRQWHAFQVLNALKLYEIGKIYKSKEKLLSFIQPLIKKIETWAQYGPILKPYLAFIYAELERVTGDFKKAGSLYFDAIAIAHEQRFTLLEAQLNECMAELIKKAGIGTERSYFAEAVRLYKSCHAERKEIFLLEKYPGYFEEEVVAYMPFEAEPTAYTLPSLDVDYLMKSSLAISAEINPDVLLKKIMNVVIEASGAQHGYLLIQENSNLIVRAESHITEKDVVRTVKYSLKDAEDLCKTIVRYVHRTQKRVILSNASKEGEYIDNPEVQAMQLRSVLCLPLIKQSKMIGILYLENRLSDAVFTLEKTEVTELLTSQAAISLENARLLYEMKQAEQALRESEEKLAGIVDSVTDFMAMIDEEFNIVWVNDLTGELLGSDFIGRKCYAAFYGLDRLCKRCVVKKCFQDGKVHKTETELVEADGQRLIFSNTASVAARYEDNRPKMVLELFHDITDHRLAEDQLKESLKEKEALLKEIHHRVKNNLQVVSSLFRLQSGYVKDDRDLEIFKESQNRVRSMSLIHEKLYQSEDMARVDFAEYTRNLTSHLLHSYTLYPANITVDIEVADVFLGIDLAIPCGLIINELVSNCLKHAFPTETKGNRICVKLWSDKKNAVKEARADNRCTLIIGDNGIGFEKDLDFRDTKTLGLQLVMTLVKQIKGEIEVDRSGGTEFKITFGIPEI
ncbi:MAG: AAA family ATPase [Thermodesulfobacteriota bacterium]|nr:AAA family ATPase [Thermodesulfobacteriota bacterium]